MTYHDDDNRDPRDIPEPELRPQHEIIDPALLDLPIPPEGDEPERPMRVYVIAGGDTVIARDAADAWEAWEAATDLSREGESYTDDDLEEVPPDKPIHILPRRA
jgi:hypothetical protein